MGYLWGLLGACGTACGEEFPNEPTGTLTVQMQPGLKDTMTVRDTANLVIQIGDSRGESITGIEVEWQSSDTAVLELQPLPPSTQAPEGSLASQLTIRSIAHARGQAVVVATIDRPGFERTELKDTITILERWTAISTGASHACAIAADSTAYCWGAGVTGALGNGIPLDTALPSAVLGPSTLKFLSISAGQDNTCGVILQAVAYCWGSGQDGRLGNGDPSRRNQLTPVPVSGGSTFQSVAAGRASCGISRDFAAFCWGDDNLLQLGIEELPGDALDTCGMTACSLTPRLVTSSPNSYSVVDVGLAHTCAVSRSPVGQALCWGTAPRGALGAGPANTTSTTPIAVLGGIKFDSITAGGEHTCGVVLTEEVAYCWGNNNHGQLGGDSPEDQSTPALVLGGPAIRSVSAGRQHTCGLSTNRQAYCWGQGDHGQLGDGSRSDRPTPVPVAGGLTFASLSAGDSYTCGVTTAGAAYCWGIGGLGQLGDGSVEDQSIPTRVSEPD